MAALVSLSLRGRAMFVQRMEENDAVVLVTHSTYTTGQRDPESAKRWAENVLAWMDAGKIGPEPVSGKSKITSPGDRVPRSGSGAGTNLVYSNKPLAYVLRALQRGSQFTRCNIWAGSRRIFDGFRPSIIYDIHYMML